MSRSPDLTTLLRLVPVLATVVAVVGGLPPAPVPEGGSAPATVVAGAAQRGRWAWPLTPRPEVRARFEAPPDPYAAGHRGVDLTAAAGQAVLAPEAGSVSFSGMVAGRPVVVVTHAGGLRSTFEPVVGVPVGTVVARGSPVGAVSGGPGHCAPVTCLHWGVRRGAAYLDPLSFVGMGPVVLKPL